MPSISKTNKRTHYQSGLRAERFAAIILCLKGYKILEKRYKTPVGEIDIIAVRNKTLIFVEVKHRPSYEKGILSISETSKKRIIRAAEYFLMKEKTSNGAHMDSFRFDAIIISPPFYIKHLVNAWTS